jgi:glycosyltransferase involved in cell wall biosynthesis
MAMGKPVICSDVPPIRDYAGDGAGCALVQPGSATALKEKIEDLLNDERELNKIARCGFERVKEMFNHDRFMECYKRVLLNDR